MVDRWYVLIMYLLSGPPSFCTASTKRSCSSGVHFSRGLASVERTRPASPPPCRRNCFSGGKPDLEDRCWLWPWSCCWWYIICHQRIPCYMEYIVVEQQTLPSFSEINKREEAHLTRSVPVLYWNVCLQAAHSWLLGSLAALPVFSLSASISSNQWVVLWSSGSETTFGFSN